MSSHTNVNISREYDTVTRLLNENELLAFKLKQMTDRARWLENEFANIIQALDDWGYVDLKVGNDPSIRIVKEKKDDACR